MEHYINFFIQKRKKAKIDFEKDFYKLFNKAFYGSAMENIRNPMRLEII